MSTIHNRYKNRFFSSTSIKLTIKHKKICCSPCIKHTLNVFCYSAKRSIVQTSLNLRNFHPIPHNHAKIHKNKSFSLEKSSSYIILGFFHTSSGVMSLCKSREGMYFCILHNNILYYTYINLFIDLRMLHVFHMWKMWWDEKEYHQTLSLFLTVFHFISYILWYSV